METYVERFVSAAQCFEGFGEIPKGSNAGQVVEAFLKLVGLNRGQPWCAAFIAWVGYRAFYDPQTQKSQWPLPLTGGCAVLGEAAQRHGILETTPQRGDVFLLYYPSKKRFAHTGIVLEVLEDGSCLTLEGNTNGGGSREGWGCLYKMRKFGPQDRFVRWATLLN